MKLNNFIILAGLILTFVMFTSTLPVVSSANEELPGIDYLFKQNTANDLKRPCVYQGRYCSNSFDCFLTIYYPNNTVYLANVNMSFNESFFNYTIYPREVGVYYNSMQCYSASNNGTETFYFKVTPSGYMSNYGTFIILLAISLILFLLAYYTENEILGFFSGTTFILTGIYTFIYGIGDLRTMYTTSISVLSASLGIIITILSSLEFMDVNWNS